MKYRYRTTTFVCTGLLLGAALACGSALAEDVIFEGHTLEVEAGPGDARTITRIVGTRYQINASAAQILGKARTCLASQDGVAVEAGEAESTQLFANSQVNYRAGWSTRSARSRIEVEISDGYFRIVQSGLGVAPVGAASAGDADYSALQQSSGWDNAATALIALQQGVIDCLYR